MTLSPQDHARKNAARRAKEQAVLCQCGCEQPLSKSDQWRRFRINSVLVREQCWNAAISASIPLPRQTNGAPK